MARPKIYNYPKIKCPKTYELFALLSEHRKVEIEALGLFEIVRIPKKTIFHNFSKRKRVIEAYNKLKFTQSPELKKLLAIEAKE